MVTVGLWGYKGLHPPFSQQKAQTQESAVLSISSAKLGQGLLKGPLQGGWWTFSTGLGVGWEKQGMWLSKQALGPKRGHLWSHRHFCRPWARGKQACWGCGHRSSDGLCGGWRNREERGGPWDQPGTLRDIDKLGLHTPWTASDIYSLSSVVLNSFSFYMVFYWLSPLRKTNSMEGAIAKNINLGGKGLPVNKTELHGWQPHNACLATMKHTYLPCYVIPKSLAYPQHQQLWASSEVRCSWMQWTFWTKWKQRVWQEATDSPCPNFAIHILRQDLLFIGPILHATFWSQEYLCSLRLIPAIAHSPFLT